MGFMIDDYTNEKGASGRFGSPQRFYIALNVKVLGMYMLNVKIRRSGRRRQSPRMILKVSLMMVRR